MMFRSELFVLLILLICNCNVVLLQFTSTGFPIKVLSNDSPWNVPIDPLTTTVDSYSANMMTKISNTLVSNGASNELSLTYFQWTCPIHLVNTSISGINRITIYNPTPEAYHETVDPLGVGKIINLPVLTTFTPDPQADGHMIVFDVNEKYFYEFSRFVWVNSTFATATRFDKFYYNSTGTYQAYKPYPSKWWMKSVRGSGAPYIAGLIRYDEVARGDLNHAIAFGGPINRMKGLSSSSWSVELCAPVACRNDGYATGLDTIAEGQRIQLNPSYNISSLPPKSKLIAQALQTYGGYMVDNAASFAIYFENKGPSATSPWVTNYGTDLTNLYNIPINQFRVLTCSNIATK